MRVLLDTNVVIRMAEQGLRDFSPPTRQLLIDLDNELLLSSISITEIAIKRSIGKLDLAPDVLDETIDDLKLTMLSYTEQHARRLFDLPLHHREPFDRMLLATAIAENVPLLTSDRDLSAYSVKIIHT